MTRTFRPTVFRFEDIVPKTTVPGSSLHQHFGAVDGASIAGGITIFKDCDIPWQLWYDEMLVCLSTDGVFEVVIGDKTHQLKSGDMMWLPAGTDLIYRSVGVTNAVWAVTPPDWEKRRP